MKICKEYINYLKIVAMSAYQTMFTCLGIQYQVKLMSFNVSFTLHITDSLHITMKIRLPIPWFYVSADKTTIMMPLH